jgi:hypothetical protein
MNSTRIVVRDQLYAMLDLQPAIEPLVPLHKRLSPRAILKAVKESKVAYPDLELNLLLLAVHSVTRHYTEVSKKSYPCNVSWEPIGLRHPGSPITLYPPKKFLVLISVRGRMRIK